MLLLLTNLQHLIFIQEEEELQERELTEEQGVLLEEYYRNNLKLYSKDKYDETFECFDKCLEINYNPLSTILASSCLLEKSKYLECITFTDD